MAMTARISGDGLGRMAYALDSLTSSKRGLALSRALNRTGQRAATGVVRALARQTGLSQTKVRALGEVTRRRAAPHDLAFLIRSKGGHIPLRHFGAKQFGYGVRAKPWGRSQRFESAFIFAGTPRSGQPVGGGNVFIRTTGSSYPIRILHGPAVPKEIVKDQSREAFEDASGTLPARLAHEIANITRQAIT